MLDYDIENGKKEVFEEVKNNFLSHPDYEVTKIKRKSKIAGLICRWTIDLVNCWEKLQHKPIETIVEKDIISSFQREPPKKREVKLSAIMEVGTSMTLEGNFAVTFVSTLILQ